MKVLLLGDASNYHATLAAGLRAIGHDVTLASDGCSWMQTGRDIDLGRRDGIVGGAMLYAKLLTVLSGRLKGYDVVQLVSPGFVHLKPSRLATLLRRLRRHNGNIYLTALGTDAVTVRNLAGPSPALPYSEWQLRGSLTPWARSAASELVQWRDEGLNRYTDTFYDTVDGAVTALYEYHRILEAELPGLPVAYGGIPVDTAALPAPELHPSGDRVKILFAAHKGREAEKGADILLPLLRRLEREHGGDVEILTPPNMPFGAFVETLSRADMVCDQLYAFTPATTALMAMAMGVVPISGGEEDFYRFIGESSARPIFNPDPLDIEGTYSRLAALVTDRAALRRMSAEAPAFVRRHNDVVTVARRFESFWNAQNRR